MPHIFVFSFFSVRLPLVHFYVYLMHLFKEPIMSVVCVVIFYKGRHCGNKLDASKAVGCWVSDADFRLLAEASGLSKRDFED